MEIKSLDIRNFRAFKNMRLTFSQQVNVFVGINGSGKTTVLDALALPPGTKSIHE